MNNIKLNLKSKIDKKSDQIYLIDKIDQLDKIDLDKNEKTYVKSQFEKEIQSAVLNRLSYFVIIDKPLEKDEEYLQWEEVRKKANKTIQFLNSKKVESSQFVNLTGDSNFAKSYIEGFSLSNYQFLKYFSDKEEKQFTIKKLDVVDSKLTKKDLEEIENLSYSVFEVRDLVNEPLSFLTAEQLSDEIKRISKKAGFTVEVFNKSKIEKLKMGGLLAVNRGTPNPPTFNILEWKPKNAKNKKPLILVGKGVVYDTGGLSLKSTKGSMDKMKSDMAGAGAVIGTLSAVALNKLPYHIIGLVPATENRPDGLAYAPGDVIKMHSGLTVEVLNTDAEGRMILADALSYAKKYDPELVVDLATLTGSAVAAIGEDAMVMMGNAERKERDDIIESGFNTYERTAELPFWEDYADLLKSDIADCKNIGGSNAGAITAGKFLEKFTDYPYIHLDIAGPSFLGSADHYRTKGGTGVGVRLLHEFIKNKTK